jgi:predicted site-specific integrase-resolvase
VKLPQHCGTKGASEILGDSPATVRVKARAGEIPVALVLTDGQRIFHIPTLQRIRIAREQKDQALTARERVSLAKTSHDHAAQVAQRAHRRRSARSRHDHAGAAGDDESAT